MQHTATHCNALQRTATERETWWWGTSRTHTPFNWFLLSCICEREGERERGRKGEREREREGRGVWERQTHRDTDRAMRYIKNPDTIPLILIAIHMCPVTSCTCVCVCAITHLHVCVCVCAMVPLLARVRAVTPLHVYVGAMTLLHVYVGYMTPLLVRAALRVALWVVHWCTRAMHLRESKCSILMQCVDARSNALQKSHTCMHCSSHTHVCTAEVTHMYALHVCYYCSALL